jgi:selenocysteine lyase/cysteine desulfurase
MIKELINRFTIKKHDSLLSHDAFFNELRDKEYARLDKKRHIYLDYTGGNLYAESQLMKHQQMLKEHVFGNPHSTNPSSKLATDLTENARKKVIEYFNAQDYFCIFTQNASGALQIVGECYPFGMDSHFLLLADNHNSVNGIREYSKSKGGSFSYVPTYYDDLTIDQHQLLESLQQYDDKKHKLFAYPAQSNVSGVKHDLSWIAKAQEFGWDVLLDAAAYVPSNTLDLQKVSPDFVTVSFYKIFGYPTGLGCLLVKKSKFNTLQKCWFAGGNVTMVAVLAPHHFLHDNHERFENGTINYLDIPAITIGLDFIESIGMKRINERVQSLIHYVYKELEHLQHDSGVKQLLLYGPKDRSKTGGTLIMSFINPDGSIVPFETVEQLSNKVMISLRSGCFCNPGIDEIFNCVTNQELEQFFSGRTSGNYTDMFNFLQKMRGATRISLGIATTKSDIDTFIKFVGSLKNKTIQGSILSH